MYRGAEILILDEPTAVLTPQEIDEFLKIMHKLLDDGKTIIIITHKLDEIKKTANCCSIYRHGKFIDTVDVCNVSEDDLATLMVGREVCLNQDKAPAVFGEEIFKIEDITVLNEKGLKAVKDLSLTIKKGEILGIAGIDGNGQKELVEAINNLKVVESGKIIMNNVEIQNTTPLNTIENKISTIHADRQKVGLVLDFSVAENLILEDFKSPTYTKNGLLQFDAMEKNALNLIERYDIRPAKCANLPVKGLSGGNQKKVIIAREVEGNPDLLIAVQPTRGLDVGAIEYIHKTLIEERDKGKAVLLISYELDEVMNLSDTLAIIYDGTIVGSYDHGVLDEFDVGLLMTGGSLNEQK